MIRFYFVGGFQYVPYKCPTSISKQVSLHTPGATAGLPAGRSLPPWVARPGGSCQRAWSPATSNLSCFSCLSWLNLSSPLPSVASVSSVAKNPLPVQTTQRGICKNGRTFVRPYGADLLRAQGDGRRWRFRLCFVMYVQVSMRLAASKVVSIPNLPPPQAMLRASEFKTATPALILSKRLPATGRKTGSNPL